jgi:hypothetical protein
MAVSVPAALFGHLPQGVDFAFGKVFARPSRFILDAGGRNCPIKGNLWDSLPVRAWPIRVILDQEIIALGHNK